MYGTMHSIFYGNGRTSLSVNDVNYYVFIVKVTRSYFSHTPIIHMPVRNPNMQDFVLQGLLAHGMTHTGS